MVVLDWKSSTFSIHGVSNIGRSILYGSLWEMWKHKNQRNTYNIDAIEQIFTRVSLYLRHTILWQREFTVNVHSLMENVLIKSLLELIISLNIGYEKNFWIRRDKVENTLEPSLVWSSRKAIHFHYPTHDIVSILLAGNESRCLPRVPPSWVKGQSENYSS